MRQDGTGAMGEARKLYIKTYGCQMNVYNKFII
ncbi:hypothetical protein SAMN05216196_101803 [Lutimaribacter pacificus]|uniref:MTTase N-terminal domain-containing protein n=1 Tax=Lutimaribacter pacificus TaxID=391948 RepID=A0A1H0C4G3_9RHOB|nr:hypothetical protein SAMN05216196_101803 [Lutimaribacter pacificus]SHJ48881.1 hypothetical protein SAMN05444142_101414 [Lutimaribacter pacificus]